MGRDGRSLAFKGDGSCEQGGYIVCVCMKEGKEVHFGGWAFLLARESIFSKELLLWERVLLYPT